VSAACPSDAIGAKKGERSPGRRGYRSGYYSRGLVTRVGKLELRIPQDRQGQFSTQIFERYQRSEKAMVSALAEMYIQGVSTRKVWRSPRSWAAMPFRHPPSVRSIRPWMRAWSDLPSGLWRKPIPTWCWTPLREGPARRGLRGVEFVVSDDHPELKRAIAEVIPEAVWQRCYVHFLRNALDNLPRKAVDDCLQELRWLYDRRDLAEAQKDLAQWLERWGQKYSKLCEWVEENIGETLTFYQLPLQHHKHLKSTNMLERFNEEIKRRTRVVRIFPNGASCLRLIRALSAETHEGWLEASRYLNMELLKEHKKLRLSLAA
jgi:putative transposase